PGTLWVPEALAPSIGIPGLVDLRLALVPAIEHRAPPPQPCQQVRGVPGQLLLGDDIPVLIIRAQDPRTIFPQRRCASGFQKPGCKPGRNLQGVSLMQWIDLAHPYLPIALEHLWRGER